MDLRRLLRTGVLTLACAISDSTYCADLPFGIVPHPDNTAHLDPGIALPGAHSPFFPSRASTDGRTVTAQEFELPELCGGCHIDIYTQWKGSMHSQSWADPVYRAALNLMSKASNGRTDNFCMGCHTPIGVVTREASPGGAGMSEVAVRGVQCEVCHNVSQISGIGNGSYVLTPRLHGRPLKFGPFKDALSPYHDSAYSKLHTQSEFCGDCHDVTHPFNRLPVERTYTEWRDSTYAGQGVQCQDCHMKPAPGRATPISKERDRIYTHYFVGGNTLVTQLLGSNVHSDRAAALLQSAAEVQILAPAMLRAAGPNSVQVRVTNVGAGHKLPTGFPEGREMWLDFRVVDARNVEIYRLGAVRDGRTEADTKTFKVTLGDRNGKVVDVNLLEADRILYDTRIEPHGRSDVTYTFTPPKGAAGPLKLIADLNYWPFSQALLDELMGKDAPPTRITKMASATAIVPLSTR